MTRICTTLAGNFEIVLVGKRVKDSPLLLPGSHYMVYRLGCWFSGGKVQYIEFNIRLFFFLLFKKMDAICAIDLDTILPCYLVSRWRRIPGVYDAHELFTEMKEVVTRPFIQKIWLTVERLCVPAFLHGYTVSRSIAAVFLIRYGVQYEVIRNLPFKAGESRFVPKKGFVLYQGAINEARGLEVLIPAMIQVPAELHIYGRGNFEEKLYLLIKQYHVQHKVFVHPPESPSELKKITDEAFIGINLVENTGLNQYYSLANKFFDYMHSGVPQVTMQYPEYEEINKAYEIAILIEELTADRVAEAINRLLNNPELHTKLRQNCLAAREVYNWQNEEKKLIEFYNNLLQ